MPSRKGKGKEGPRICTHKNLLARVSRVKSAGGEFISLSCRLLESGEVLVEYFFDLDGEPGALACRSRDRSLPSLYSLYPQADYPEREASARFRIKFTGNPNLSPEALLHRSRILKDRTEDRGPSAE